MLKLLQSSGDGKARTYLKLKSLGHHAKNSTRDALHLVCHCPGVFEVSPDCVSPPCVQTERFTRVDHLVVERTEL